MTQPSPCNSFTSRFARQNAAVVVVGGDVAHRLGRFQRRIVDQYRYSLGNGRLDRLHERPGIKRCDHDSVDTCRQLHSDELDLQHAVVFFLGPCQITFDIPQLLGSLERARVKGLQNSCVVPFGITITLYFLACVPERLDALVLSTWGDEIKGATSGSFIFSGVTSVSPVENLLLDRLLFEMLGPWS